MTTIITDDVEALFSLKLFSTIYVKKATIYHSRENAVHAKPLVKLISQKVRGIRYEKKLFFFNLQLPVPVNFDPPIVQRKRSARKL